MLSGGLRLIISVQMFAVVIIKFLYFCYYVMPISEQNNLEYINDVIWLKVKLKVNNNG
ncbi:hypothetical protein RINTHH_820 [Richelia intracellularis HH01]|uniref:Uncharacterized protein n=1 Tax=Richelia intracellularis HH01 TaxID=1165094 RepID=M1WXB7_9NOST|nr:hypothetical protein RINTHH_820 [Richelia intracellularis HH01]